MSELAPVLILAAVAFVLLLHWRWRNAHQGVTIEQFSRAQEAVDALIGEFSLGKRIFEAGDMTAARLPHGPPLETGKLYISPKPEVRSKPLV